ncbi:MAG TPA: glycosyltransferase family 2 protein [Ignavibacteria bacterium]|nr:glycosyltransferase family 2 protein [Ignavibacteria bacterium]
MDKDISIIIITWNALHFLEKCLPSIYAKNHGTDFELILIDNNSTDGTKEYVMTNYPDTRYIFNDHNRGVAPARNQGFKIAQGKYILILDVDTEFITDSPLKQLKEYMDNNPDSGLIGAQLVSGDGEIQRSCLKFPSVWIKLFVRFERFSFIKNSRMLKEYYMEDFDHESVLEVDYVIGAFQFIRKTMIDKIGYYDEHIFYGPEDIDYCLRAKNNGYKVVYYPKVKLFHFYQRITKRLFTKITFKHFAGLAYFFRKHRYVNYPKLK